METEARARGALSASCVRGVERWGFFSDPPLARNSGYKFASRSPHFRLCSSEIRKNAKFCLNCNLCRFSLEVPAQRVEQKKSSLKIRQFKIIDKTCFSKQVSQPINLT